MIPEAIYDHIHFGCGFLRAYADIDEKHYVLSVAPDGRVICREIKIPGTFGRSISLSQIPESESADWTPCRGKL